jgi:hypothetical protein
MKAKKAKKFKSFNNIVPFERKATFNPMAIAVVQIITQNKITEQDLLNAYAYIEANGDDEDYNDLIIA